MLTFNVEKLSNIKFSFDELTSFYKTIKKDYQSMEYRSKVFPNGYSYAMQTKLADPTQPCFPYDAPGEEASNYKFDTPTPLMFGFAKKLLDAFPYAKQMVITTHGPGAQIEFHIDKELYNDEEHVKIHIPIETNDSSYFQFEDEEVVLECGSVYLVNTTVPHGTINKGTTERAHLIFKVPLSSVDNILTKELVI
jgi:hypothetical protein